MPQHERGDNLGPVRQVHLGGTLTASSATPPAACPGNAQGGGSAFPAVSSRRACRADAQDSLPVVNRFDVNWVTGSSPGCVEGG
jgi:hypothetical protein